MKRAPCHRRRGEMKGELLRPPLARIGRGLTEPTRGHARFDETTRSKRHVDQDGVRRRDGALRSDGKTETGVTWAFHPLRRVSVEVVRLVGRIPAHVGRVTLPRPHGLRAGPHARGALVIVQPPPCWRSRYSSRSSLRASDRSRSRIEPMVPDGSPEHRREVAGEVRDVRAAPVPERPAIRNGLEGEDLLYAAVAVGRDDEDDVVGKAHHDIVIELALLPVVEELVSSMPRSKIVEESAEYEMVSKSLQVSLHPGESIALPDAKDRPARSVFRCGARCATMQVHG